MRRYWIAGSTLAVVILLSYFAMNLSQRRAYALDPYDDITSWQPDARAVLAEIGPGDPGGHFRDERHTRFARLLQQRFRSHDPALAVGIQFRGPSLIKLMCPARFEPWNSDSLAFLIWQEAKTAFGKSFDIDIYATYIGMPPVRIGTLRPHAAQPDAAQVVLTALPRRR